ncbi:hypothetical protein [Nocardiopsis ganjiahuensis]|uniref:hypothetical protein n=1 Tax=Nocardiopsis ganjiahuensis TaxID=239984 RepID=UPI001EF9F116|nr:hypothetical protein [Nocardiopsis ganjiahuensis]
MTTPETAPAPQSRPNPFASSAVTVLSFAVLLVTGLAVGVLSGFSMGWVSHYWDAGLAAQAAGVAALVAFVVLLYALCRLAGWGSRRQSGALAFALGYVAVMMAMLGYVTGGSILFPVKLVNYVFLFGSMIALAAGVVRSFVLPPRTTPPARAQSQN